MARVAEAVCKKQDTSNASLQDLMAQMGKLKHQVAQMENDYDAARCHTGARMSFPSEFSALFVPATNDAALRLSGFYANLGDGEELMAGASIDTDALQKQELRKWAIESETAKDLEAAFCDDESRTDIQMKIQGASFHAGTSLGCPDANIKVRIIEEVVAGALAKTALTMLCISGSHAFASKVFREGSGSYKCGVMLQVA